MIFRIDPRFTSVWRSPTELQFGIEDARLVLTDLLPVEEHLIAALERGATRGGLAVVARSHAVDDTVLDSLLDRMTPLLERSKRRLTVRLVGSGPQQALHQLTEVLAGQGCDVTFDRGREGAHRHELYAAPAPLAGELPELAILISDHVVSPGEHGRWLREDVPHLPVVFGSQSARVGPLVLPGTTPCLYCVDRERSDADPAWPAIASQLWGRPSSAATPLITSETVALTVRVVERWRDEVAGAEPQTGGVEFRVDVATGEVSERQVRQHPECGCADLGGSGSASVTPIAAARRAPMTIEATSGPA